MCIALKMDIVNFGVKGRRKPQFTDSALLLYQTVLTIVKTNKLLSLFLPKSSSAFHHHHHLLNLNAT